MTINIKSGFEFLVEGVTAYLLDKGVDVFVGAGIKERARQLNQALSRANRVVFMPCDLSGKAGRVAYVRQPGGREIGDPSVGRTRTLGDWDRQLLVSVWAHDGNKPSSEMAQIIAVEALFEWVARAVHHVAFAVAKWGDITWTIPPERALGMEILAGLTLELPILDTPTETAFPEVVKVTRKLGTTTVSPGE